MLVITKSSDLVARMFLLYVFIYIYMTGLVKSVLKKHILLNNTERRQRRVIAFIIIIISTRIRPERTRPNGKRRCSEHIRQADEGIRVTECRVICRIFPSQLFRTHKY